MLGSSSDLGSAGASVAVSEGTLPWGLWSTQCLAPTLLCGIGRVTPPLWALTFSSIKWGEGRG